MKMRYTTLQKADITDRSPLIDLRKCLLETEDQAVDSEWVVGT